MAFQSNPIFIQACDEKIYGNKIWINVNLIVQFRKSVSYSSQEGQWYEVLLIDGKKCYTLYNLALLNTYNLPDF